MPLRVSELRITDVGLDRSADDCIFGDDLPGQVAYTAAETLYGAWLSAMKDPVPARGLHKAILDDVRATIIVLEAWKDWLARTL